MVNPGDLLVIKLTREWGLPQDNLAISRYAPNHEVY